VTESCIHHFAAQAKLASISREFSVECFDFDRRSLEGKDVLAVLVTRFGKSLIEQSFVLQADLHAWLCCGYVWLRSVIAY